MEPLRAGDPAWVGGFRIVARLGAGGMGTVFLARSPGARLAAVKVVRAEFAGDEGFRERFRREIEAARRVGGAYTAPVLDGDADAREPWLAVAFVPAPTLGEAVKRFGTIPEPALRALGAGLVEALQAVHAAGLVHRDLKPGNILLAEDGPKVIDFGITRALDASRLTGTGGMVGTPAFMSPEQISTGDASAASDVFSLGGVLVYAATGSGPFSEGDPASLLYRVMYGEPQLDGVPGSLRALVAACLDKDPAKRPELSKVLDALAPGDPAALVSMALRQDVAARQQEATALASMPVTAPPPLPRVKEPGRRHALKLAAVAAVGVVGAGAGTAAWAMSRPTPKKAKPAPRVTGLVSAPPPVWDAVWPPNFADRSGLSVALAGDMVVWRGRSGIVGMDAASGEQRWAFEKKTGDTFGPGYRVFGNTVVALSAEGLLKPHDQGPPAVYLIDAASGVPRQVPLPGDIDKPSDAFGIIGGTVFVSAALPGDSDRKTALAVDAASGRVLWSYPTGGKDVFGIADGVALYLCTASKVIALDPAGGRPRWSYTWYTGPTPKSTAYPLVLGDGMLYFCATGSSSLQAIRTQNGTPAWKKDLVQRPVTTVGANVITVGDNGFHAYDQATGAARWQQTTSPASIDDLFGSTAGSARLLAAEFADETRLSDDARQGGFYVAATGGGPSWAHWGPTYFNTGWSLATSDTSVFATDSRRLYCFRGGA